MIFGENVFKVTASLIEVVGGFIRSFIGYLISGAPRPIKVIFFLVLLGLFGWAFSFFLSYGYVCVGCGDGWDVYKATGVSSILVAHTIKDVGLHQMHMGKITRNNEGGFFGKIFGKIIRIFRFGYSEKAAREMPEVESNFLSYGRDVGAVENPDSVYILLPDGLTDADLEKLASVASKKVGYVLVDVCRVDVDDEDDPSKDTCLVTSSSCRDYNDLDRVARARIYFYDGDNGKEVNVHFDYIGDLEDCVYSEPYKDVTVELIIGEKRGYVTFSDWFNLDYYGADGTVFNFVEQGIQFDPEISLKELGFEKVEGNTKLIRVDCVGGEPSILFLGIPVFDITVISVFIFGLLLVSIVNFFRR